MGEADNYSKRTSLFFCFILFSGIIGVSVYFFIAFDGFKAKTEYQFIPRCSSVYLGDGICDDQLNNGKCNFDNGDCCQTIMIKSNCLMCLCYKTLGVSTVEVVNVTDSAISDE